MSPSIVLERQDVRAFITVPRDAENRRPLVTLEAPAYYTCTERQLNGEGAALIHELVFKHLPEGEYRVRVVVESARGKDQAVETKFDVRGALPVVPPGARP